MLRRPPAIGEVFENWPWLNGVQTWDDVALLGKRNIRKLKDRMRGDARSTIYCVQYLDDLIGQVDDKPVIGQPSKGDKGLRPYDPVVTCFNHVNLQKEDIPEEVNWVPAVITPWDRDDSLVKVVLSDFGLFTANLYPAGAHARNLLKEQVGYETDEFGGELVFAMEDFLYMTTAEKHDPAFLEIWCNTMPDAQRVKWLLTEGAGVLRNPQQEAWGHNRPVRSTIDALFLFGFQKLPSSKRIVELRYQQLFDRCPPTYKIPLHRTNLQYGRKILQERCTQD